MTISRYICTTLISLCAYVSLMACSCITPPSLCEYSKYLETRESQLIVIGSVVDEILLDSSSTFAYKIEIENIIRGSVTTGASTIPIGSGFINTDNEIWMLGGQSATCLRTLGGRLLIATEYDSLYFGYQPTICLNDTYEINSANEITGFLWDENELATISLEDIDEVLNGQCTSSVEEFRKQIESSLTIFPNPTVDELVIFRNERLVGDLEYKLHNMLGEIALSGQVGREEVLSLEPFTSGVYVLTVYLDGYHYSRLIVRE